MRPSPLFRALPLIAVTLVLPASRAAASWPADTTAGLPITRANSNQYEPVVVSDGAGGFITVWSDLRKVPTFDVDLYARRVDAAGDTLWDGNGTAVCTATGDARYPSALADGSGGVFVAWTDLRGAGGIYAQRLNSDGQPQWGTNGVRVSATFNSSLGPHLCSDDAGGVFVTWGAGPLSAAGALCQRLNGSGVSQWVFLTTLRTGSRAVPSAIVPDGTGGAMITIADGVGADVFAQRINSDGTLPWGASGATVCAAAGAQTPGPMVTDGAGGFVTAWTDHRNGNDDIYARRVNSAGVPQWAVDGVPVCAQPSGLSAPVLRALPGANVVVAWLDWRASPWALYAQRLAADGSALWATDGVVVNPGVTGSIPDYSIAPAAGDTSFVLWNYTSNEVRVQRLTGEGVPLWGPIGKPVCHAANGFQHGVALPDGLGGLFVVYQLGTGDYNLAAQHLGPDGSVGTGLLDVPAPSVGPAGPLRMSPNPWRLSLHVTLAAPAVAGDRIDVFDISGRRAAGGLLVPATTSWNWDGRDREGRTLGAGVYLVRVAGRQGIRIARTIRIE